MALMTEYSPPPSFTDGQILSSSGHLNTMVRDVNILLGEHMYTQHGYASPVLSTSFRGIAGPGGMGQPFFVGRLFVGVIRHKRPVFSFSIRVTSTAGQWVHLRVRVGAESENLVKELTYAPSTPVPFDATSTIDVSKLTVNSFHEVFVDVWASASQYGEAGESLIPARILYIGETYNATFPNLAAFNTGVQTAQQWQDVSDYITTLYNYFTEPCVVPAMRGQLGDIAAHNWGWTTGNDDTSRFNIRHRHRYLAYQFHIATTPTPTKKTWHGRILVNGARISVSGQTFARGISCLSDDIDATQTTIGITGPDYYAGQHVRITNGEVILLGPFSNGSFTNCLRAQQGSKAADAKKGTGLWHWTTDHAKNAKKDYFPIKDHVTYRGFIDLTSQTLSPGTLYTFEVASYGAAHYDADDDSGLLTVDYLFETPSTDPYLSGWAPLTLHTALTNPRTTIQALRNDLIWLYARETYLNPVSPNLSINETDRGGFFSRRRRYLHYYTMSDEQDGTLTFYINGREQSQSISPGTYKWNLLDLNSVAGLFPGTIYRVTGVSYALEDDQPSPVYDLDLET